LKTIRIAKGTLIQNAGDVNTKVLYHVVSGILRSYTLDDKGKEHVFLFAPEGWTIADNNPTGTPADLYIDALEAAEIQVFEKDFEREKEHVAALIKRLATLQKRVIMLKSATAIERYEHFEKTYPNILQRVTQKMIASYLGITPEALSKIKKDRIKSI